MTDVFETATAAVGPVGELFDDVEEIAVLRGGGLGDLLFAVPAIEALAAAYPAARITLLGTPLHAELVPRRLVPDVDVVEVPASQGVREGEEDPEETARFFERLDGVFDLAAQLHGGGRFSNPFLLRLNARHTIGAATQDAAPLERVLPYAYYQSEVLRALEIVGLAGAHPVSLAPTIRPTEADREAAARLLTRASSPTIVVHPGASDPRRRWPAIYFAEVAARLVDEGCTVVLVGDATDAALARTVVEETRALLPAWLRGKVRSLAGRLRLGELAAVLQAADIFLGNDSGPRHLAQAVGTPTVAIYWFGNLINAGPLGRANDRVQLSWTTSCPICGRDSTQVGWTAERCEHDVSFVSDVQPLAVYGDVVELMATTPPPRDR